jgi:hypothetical protein
MLEDILFKVSGSLPGKAESEKQVLEIVTRARLLSGPRFDGGATQLGLMGLGRELEVQGMETRNTSPISRWCFGIKAGGRRQKSYNQRNWSCARQSWEPTIHPDTLISMNNLAFTLKGQGQGIWKE